MKNTIENTFAPRATTDTSFISKLFARGYALLATIGVLGYTGGSSEGENEVSTQDSLSLALTGPRYSNQNNLHSLQRVQGRTVIRGSGRLHPSIIDSIQSAAKKAQDFLTGRQGWSFFTPADQPQTLAFETVDGNTINVKDKDGEPITAVDGQFDAQNPCIALVDHDRNVVTATNAMQLISDETQKPSYELVRAFKGYKADDIVVRKADDRENNLLGVQSKGEVLMACVGSKNDPQVLAKNAALINTKVTGDYDDTVIEALALDGYHAARYVRGQWVHTHLQFELSDYVEQTVKPDQLRVVRIGSQMMISSNGQPVEILDLAAFQPQFGQLYAC